MVGAIGAFSFRDGIATGGQVRSPICRIGNVEHNEQSFPLLTLYRRENTDSGGAGKYRGGNSAITAFIPYGTREIEHETESSGAAIPTAPGLAGGYPACTNAYAFKRDTDILEWFRARRLPGDITELARRDAIVARLGGEPRPPVTPRPPVLFHVTECLDLVAMDGARHLGCARCGHVLCAARENYKAHALRIDRPIQAANPLIGDPQRFIDAAVQFRQFHCPACGGLIENEVSRAEDSLLRDIELAE